MVKSSDIFENDCILLVCGWRYNMSDVILHSAGVWVAV